jgi:pimeloyl-ACP methyl ester carboxylesterase
MGAKIAMTVALRQPSLIANLVVVDNAPIDAVLQSDFHSYVKGMKDVERAQVMSQKQADELLKPYAKVRDPGLWWPTVRFLWNPRYLNSLAHLATFTSPDMLTSLPINRNSPSANSS